MNLTHRGKIGRLPKALQEEVNRRLELGERGGPLVAWLNSLPEVQAMLAEEFAGKPIREQNLSDWRKHGYKEWLWRKEALEAAQAMPVESWNSPAPGAPPLADQMASWVSVRYLLAVRKLVAANAGGGSGLKLLREFLHDVVALRRGDLTGARLKLDAERMQYMLEKMEAKFQEA